MPFACALSEPLTVEVRDGETMTDALLRELRATTATLAHLHNMLIGDDTTPGGERLRRDVLEAITVTVAEESANSDALYQVWRRLRAGNDLVCRGTIREAVVAELGRVISFNRSPLALLAVQSTWADIRNEEVARG